MVDCVYKTESSQCQHKNVFTKNQVVTNKLCSSCPFRSDTIDSGNLRNSLPIITVAGPEMQGPSLVQMGLNFGQAVIKQGAALARGEDGHVPKEVYEERLSICQSCDFYKDGRCLHQQCGCYISRKLRWTTQECPVGKWGAHLPSGSM